MAKITLSQLETANACGGQRKLFKELFGDSIEITIDLAEKYFDKFDVDWVAESLLNSEYLAEYEKIRDSAWGEYLKITKPAYAEYEKIVDSDWGEFRKIRDSALNEYLKIVDSAWAEYRKIRDSAYAEYEKIKAKAFVELYIQQETKD
jgi:hypothetical protein